MKLILGTWENHATWNIILSFKCYGMLIENMLER